MTTSMATPIQGLMDQAARAKQTNLTDSKQKSEPNLCSLDAVVMRCGVPMRYKDASFDDFPWQPKNFTADYGNLFVTGPSGTGKTHLLCACLREVCRESLECGKEEEIFAPRGTAATIRFLPVPEFLLQIKQTYNKEANRTEEDVLNQYSQAKVLALDDLGAERVSNWSIQILYMLIDRRYRDLKQTFVSSNLTLKQLAEKLDVRISSRIAQMCKPIKFSGQDRRTARKEG